MSGSVVGSIAIATAASVPIFGTQNSYVGDVLMVIPRAIGTVIPDVLIEEVNRDELEITQHPVERGSPITDHSFKRPVEVTMRVAWSNSGHDPGYIHDVYGTLLALQATRTPFVAYTGKRTYSNMLMAALIQTSNADAGDYTLMIQVMLREIIIVDTKSVTVPASALGSKTNDFSGVTAQSPKTLPVGQSDSLSTQTAPFNGVQELEVNNPNPYPTNLTVVPTIGQGGA